MVVQAFASDTGKDGLLTNSSDFDGFTTLVGSPPSTKRCGPKRLSPHPTNPQEPFMLKTGQIKLYSPETGCGVIQADDDSSVVLFFRRACVVELYSPAVGDQRFFPATDESNQRPARGVPCDKVLSSAGSGSILG